MVPARVIQLTFVAAVFLAAVTWKQGSPPGADYEGKAYTFTKIRDDIYHAVGTGNLAIGSNAVVVINAAEVLLVDSHVSPAAAHVLLKELRAITRKPVRYVVNTHFHFDHVHGNQIYGPGVEIIGHDVTRELIAGGASMRGRGYERFITTLPQSIATLKAQRDTASSDSSRIRLQRRLRVQENYKLATDAVKPVPPSISFNRELTLYRGGRAIHLMYVGRGHTGGDVVVHLPQEKALITGDLLTAGLSYMGDAYIPEWIQALESLKPLDFDIIMPGHGAPVQRVRIDHFQAYLRDFWEQVRQLHSAGVPASDAARRIDLRKHAPNYPSITTVGADADGVLRAYDVLNASR